MKVQIQAKKETPIIFQADSIKAILENKKFQTRRLIKPQPRLTNACDGQYLEFANGQQVRPVLYSQEGRRFDEKNGRILGRWRELCPYGGVGASLWVRETWAAIGMAANLPIKEMNKVYGDNIVYRASESHTVYHDWKSSIFMPEWASRIRFTLSGIRIERVSDISREDAFKEGIEVFHPAMHYYCDEGTDLDPTPVHRCDPVGVYQRIWNDLHAKPKRSKKNPYTGEKEDCYVSYPFQEGDNTGKVRDYQGYSLYVIPSPWVWVLEWEEVIVRRKKSS